MTSRPVSKETDGVPVVLRAYLKRHGTVAKNLLLLTIDQQRRPGVEPAQQHDIHLLGEPMSVDDCSPFRVYAKTGCAQ